MVQSSVHPPCFSRSNAPVEDTRLINRGFKDGVSKQQAFNSPANVTSLAGYPTAWPLCVGSPCHSTFNSTFSSLLSVHINEAPARSPPSIPRARGESNFAPDRTGVAAAPLESLATVDPLALPLEADIHVAFAVAHLLHLRDPSPSGQHPAGFSPRPGCVCMWSISFRTLE